MNKCLYKILFVQQTPISSSSFTHYALHSSVLSLCYSKYSLTPPLSPLSFIFLPTVNFEVFIGILMKLNALQSVFKL